MKSPLESPENTTTETTRLLPQQQQQQQQSEEDRILPQRSCALRSFKIVSSIAVLISTVMVTVQIVAVLVYDWWIIPNLLRLYISIFCMILILTELRVESLVRNVPSYNNWVYRGFLYSFLGLIGVVMAMASETETIPTSLNAKQMIVHLILLSASYSMFGLGLIYMLMGICCLHHVWERMKAGYDAEMDKVNLTTKKGNNHVI